MMNEWLGDVDSWLDIATASHLHLSLERLDIVYYLIKHYCFTSYLQKDGLKAHLSKRKNRKKKKRRRRRRRRRSKSIKISSPCCNQALDLASTMNECVCIA
jgi:hypothetical protein